MDPVLVATITIERSLGEDGQDELSVEAVDAGGEDLPLMESLGMLRLAEDTVIRLRMGELGDT